MPSTAPANSAALPAGSNVLAFPAHAIHRDPAAIAFMEKRRKPKRAPAPAPSTAWLDAFINTSVAFQFTDMAPARIDMAIGEMLDENPQTVANMLKGNGETLQFLAANFGALQRADTLVQEALDRLMITGGAHV